MNQETKNFSTMKKLMLSFFVVLFASTAYSQELKDYGTLPSIDIKNINGESFNTSQIENDGKPVVVCFWATWCSPCMAELNAISDLYEDWVEDYGVKLYAVSVDNARSSSRAKSTANGNNWEFEVLLDPNNDFGKAMQVANPPKTFILNGDGTIVWQHVKYAPGDEEEYEEVLKKLSGK